MTLSQTSDTQLALSRSSIPNLNTVATSSLNRSIQRLIPLNRNFEMIGRRENNLKKNEDENSGICRGPQGVNESKSLVADSEQPHQSSYGLQNTTKDDLTSSTTQSLKSSQNGYCSSISNELTFSKTNKEEESTAFMKTFVMETENDFSIHNNDQPMGLNQGTFAKQYLSDKPRSNDHISTDQPKELGKLHASSNGFWAENTQEEKDLEEVELSTLIEKFATKITTEILKDLI